MIKPKRFVEATEMLTRGLASFSADLHASPDGHARRSKVLQTKANHETVTCKDGNLTQKRKMINLPTLFWHIAFCPTLNPTLRKMQRAKFFRRLDFEFKYKKNDFKVIQTYNLFSTSIFRIERKRTEFNIT